MKNTCRLVVLLGVVCPLLACSAAVDAPKGMVRVEAVVQQYEIGAMEDLFDDGRFASYDAVTLKLLAPPEMANKTIQVFVAFGSVEDDSPMRKSGQRCRFDFEKSLLKESQLFQGALENLEWIVPQPQKAPNQ